MQQHSNHTWLNFVNRNMQMVMYTEFQYSPPINIFIASNNIIAPILASPRY